MRKSFAHMLAAAGILAIVGTASAQTVTTVVDEATIVTALGITDINPRGLGVTADGNTFFYFDDSADNFVRIASGVASVWATEADVLADLGLTGLNCDDITVDQASGQMYAVIRPDGSGTLEQVVRIPSAGVFENVVNTANSQGANFIDVDPSTSRLYIGFSTFAGAADFRLDYVGLTGTDLTPTTLVAGNANYAAGLSPTTVDSDPSDMVVRPDGTIVFCNAFGATDQDGDLLVVTPTGPTSATVAALVDRVPVLTAMGNAAGTFGESFIEVNATNQVIFFHNGGSDPFENIAIIRADGSSVQNLLNEAALLAGTTGADTDIGSAARGVAMDAAGNFYFPNGGANGEGITRVSGLGFTSVETWNLM